MALDKSEVEKIAHLARLGIDETQIEAMAGELSAILDFIEQMSAVDTTNITPMAHPMDLSARLRKDDVTESNQREKFQAGAPATEDGLYLVPRVIE